MIRFVTLSKVCEMAAKTICVGFGNPEVLCRCNSNCRFTLPSTLRRESAACRSACECAFALGVEVDRAPPCARYHCDASVSKRHDFLRYRKLYLPECAVLYSLLSWFQTLGSGQHWQGRYGFYPRTRLHRTEQNPCGLACPCGPS